MLKNRRLKREKDEKSMRTAKERGITLIAVIVTIIVLLILAGITVGVLTGDNGIIKNANKAKEETKIANEKEIIEKATVQAMGNNKYGNVEEDELQSALDKETEEGKTQAKDVGEVIKILFVESNRNYAVDNDGNVREIIWWETSDGEGNNYVTNGDITLQIGDYITYDANDNGEYTYTANAEKTGASGEGQVFSSNYETEWRLLGVEHTNENDCLMLVPATLIQSTIEKGFSVGGIEGYIYGIEEMENISKIYGHGSGALYARAIKMEDINKITGYDPMNTGDGKIYNQGKDTEYLNEFTVTKKEVTSYEFKCKNGAEVPSYTYGAFRYFNEENKYVNLEIGQSVTLTCTYYSYYPTTLTDDISGEEKGISKNSREYSMLFSDNYWIADKYFGGTENINLTTHYGFFRVMDGVVRTIGARYCIAVGGNRSLTTFKIMPVVYMNADIQLTETGNKVNSCTEWKINS